MFWNKGQSLVNSANHQKNSRFAEWYLSNGKADSNHFCNVSLGNCLLRIAGSHNSKCIAKNSNVADLSTQVRIIQQWNGERAPIYLLIGSFHAYLVDQKYKEMKELQRYRKNKNYLPKASRNSNNSIPWIEKLLQTPINDYRKYAVWRILAPYLVNVRKLSCEKGFNIIKEWLDKCNNLKKLDFNANSKISGDLNRAVKGGYFHISLDS